MNVKRELIQIVGVVNVVCRDNGDLEIYYIDQKKLEKIKNEVLRFINAKCLNSCFTKINFIQVEDGKKYLLFCDNPACFATHLAKKKYGVKDGKRK